MVVYESMFGDNRQVAEQVAAGLTEGGVAAEAVEVGVAPTAVPDDVDLVVVGSPNHAWSMPRPSTRADAATKTTDPLVSTGIGVREWLAAARLPQGVAVAAYDTRGSHPRSVVAFDHASTSIDKWLVRLGGRRLAPAEHFLVVDVTGPLQPGEPERGRSWGTSLAVLLTG